MVKVSWTPGFLQWLFLMGEQSNASVEGRAWAVCGVRLLLRKHRKNHAQMAKNGPWKSWGFLYESVEEQEYQDLSLLQQRLGKQTGPC